MTYQLKVEAINITDFIEIKTITDDMFSENKNGNIVLQYYDKNGDYVACIDYRVFVGQITFFFVFDKYKGKGIGKQILSKVISHMKEHKTKNIWVVTNNDHYFWSNVFNHSFKPLKNVHESCSMFGYSMKI